MPQLLLLAALGAGVYFGARWLGRKADEMMRQDRRPAAAAEPPAPAPRGVSEEIPTLVQDPETGVYKIDGRDD